MASKVQEMPTLLPNRLAIDTYVSVNGANGAQPLTLEYDPLADQPLTEADFLDPKEGMQFMQGPRHSKDTSKLSSIFEYLYQDDATTVVLSDVKMVWGIEGLSDPAPDVAVIPNVLVPPEELSASFDVNEHGTRPTFVLEVVSPQYRDADREKKVPVYEKAQVQEYVIVDHTKKSARGRRSQHHRAEYEVLGYRLAGKRYLPIQPNEQGFLYSQVLGVWIGPNETKDEIWVIDGKTGERILPGNERANAEEQKRQQAEQKALEFAIKRQEEAQKRKQAEQKTLEFAIKRQEEAQKRKQAEQKALEFAIKRQEEAQKRKQAEQKALEFAIKRQEEAQKRKQAEQKVLEAERQAQEEAQKRLKAERQAQEAERQAQEEAQKRQEAERQAQTMAAELARLRELLGLAGEG